MSCSGAGLDELPRSEKVPYITWARSVALTEYETSESSSSFTLTCTVLMVLANFALGFSDLMLSNGSVTLLIADLLSLSKDS